MVPKIPSRPPKDPDVSTRTIVTSRRMTIQSTVIVMSTRGLVPQDSDEDLDGDTTENDSDKGESA